LNIFIDYRITVLLIGLTSVLFLVQLLVVDVFSLKRKHRPGFPVKPNHDDIFFRATRAIENSNESAAIFILAIIFAIFSWAEPYWLNIFCGCYLVGRVGHMIFYYLNIELLRSAFFALSLIGVFAILILGFYAWV